MTIGRKKGRVASSENDLPPHRVVGARSEVPRFCESCGARMVPEAPAPASAIGPDGVPVGLYEP